MKIGCVLGMLVLLFLCFETDLYATEQKVAFTVGNDGSIHWSASEKKATSGIRWQIQGYHVLLEKTKPGEPLKGKKRGEFISLFVDNRYVFVSEDRENKKRKVKAKKGFQTTRFRLEGSYIKKQIRRNKEFYQEFLKKIKTRNDETLYLNAFFETYEVVPYGSIRDKVIRAFKGMSRKHFDGKYYVLNGRYYDYDERDGIVKLIRKRNLSDLKSIQSAENWTERTKKQWESENYFNYKIMYRVTSNMMIRFVDERGRNIGAALVEKKKIGRFDLKEIREKNRKIWNPRSGFRRTGVSEQYLLHNREGKFGEEVFIEKFDRLSYSAGEKKYEYEFQEAYVKDGNGKKKIPEETKKEGREFFRCPLELSESEFFAVYRLKGSPGFRRHKDEVSGSGEVFAEAKIGAGSRENEDFEIESGIPSGEEYYKQVIAPSYFVNYTFKRKSGMKTYRVISRAVWNLSWKEKETEKGKEIQKKRTETVSYITEVQRPYSYWTIDQLEVYVLSGAYVSNPAIPDSNTKMLPKGLFPPEIETMTKKRQKDHVKKPKELEGVIEIGELSFEGMEVPDYDPTALIEQKVGGIRVRNDKLIFNGELIMDDGEALTETKAPKILLTEGRMIDKDVLYSEGKTIVKEINNGEFLSKGGAEYSLLRAIGSRPAKKFFVDISDINSIVVHTPAVCDYLFKDCREWCQLLRPDKSFYQLVPTKSFRLQILSGGRHLLLKGYGYRDYEKYSGKKEVIFPFDVYRGKELIRAGKATELKGMEEFILPREVKEGKYYITIKNYALNATGTKPKEAYYANLERDQSIAVNNIKVEVSGRIFGLTLTGIKHSSLWEESFRKGKYKGGISLEGLPLKEGDHPVYKNEGSFKKGYAVRLAVTTLGAYREEPYGVGMDVKFFVYDKNYRTKEEADLYYEAVSEQTGRGLGLVKAGGERDRRNLHFVSVKDKKIPLFTYKKVLFPKELLHEKSDDFLQRWRGEYSLPARIYLCRKGFPLEEYIKKHSTLNFHENFWFKEGKLVIHADLYTMKGGKKELGYLNTENEEEGFLNNWKKETEGRDKVRSDGSHISFDPGDLFIYDIQQTIWNERRAEVKLLN